MRVPLDWLAELVDLPEPSALRERLEMAGFEDVAVEDTGPDLGALRVGAVRERGAHPNADRLSLCRVDVGEEEPLEIVCGAPNVAAGQKVAVALPGTKLPDGTKLKRTKIRGVASHGMICSARELGLGEDAAGILVLPDSARVGAPLPEALDTGARVLELGLTPNRGDAASLLGVAREVRALFGGTLRVPPCEPPEAGAPSVEAVRVTIDARDRCHHYVGRVVRGVRVGPSPEPLRRRLEAAGFRSVNNVVDVTNAVLLELGQPLHAFDLATLRGGEIRVRRAEPGEKLLALDGRTLALDPDDLVIADAERPVALAGVMGGADTEVGERTTDLLLESAHFHPTGVRRSARRHGLSTEASYRFERGVDPEGVARASERAARLLAEHCGGSPAPGAAEDRGEPHPVPPPIALEVPRANRLLGTAIDRDEARQLLARVGVEAEPEGEGRLRCRVPSHRNDLWIPQDLVEEVARIHGYDRIPTTRPVAELAPATRPATWGRADATRDGLAAAGMTEVVTLPFVAPADLDGLRLPEGDPLRRLVRVRNPIHEDESHLRSTLLPSLLRVAGQNRARQVDSVRIFEVARAFRARGPGELPEEPLLVAGLWVRGEERGLFEPEPPPLFYEVRGVAERLLKFLGYVASLRPDPERPYLHPGAAAGVFAGEERVGALGELHPEVAARAGLDAPAAALELDLTRLGRAPPRPRRVAPVSRQPQVRRDLAVVVDADVPGGEVLEAIRGSGGDLVSADVFDRYTGRGVPEGRVSLAFRLVFQRADRTLTFAEVQKATERIVRMLSHRFGAELR